MARSATSALRERPPRLRHRRASAGQVLGVGLLCFALWLVVDARQLLTSASSAPLGVRRSVAMSILRPIARTSEFFGIDRIVDGANRVLGRGVTTPGGLGSLGSAAAPTRGLGAKATGSGAKTGAHRHPPAAVGSSGVNPLVGALAQPSVAHPLSILEIGDSIGEDLGDGLEDLLGGNRAVSLVQGAQGDTGLANLTYYNWPLNLELELRHKHPTIVVVLLGGNDWQSFSVTKARNANLGTAFWRAQYEARVASLMAEATAAGARMIWVGLPPMGPSSPFPSAMAPTLNRIYADEASLHPGVSYLSSWKLFSNASGAYAQYLPDAKGNIVDVRDPDEVHLALPGGSDLLASAVIARIEQLYKINI